MMYQPPMYHNYAPPFNQVQHLNSRLAVENAQLDHQLKHLVWQKWQQQQQYDDGHQWRPEMAWPQEEPPYHTYPHMYHGHHPTQADFLQAADVYEPAYSAPAPDLVAEPSKGALAPSPDSAPGSPANDDDSKPRPIAPWLEGVTSPCEHKDPADWKRLRLKKGMQQLLCFKCGTKWKVPFRPMGQPSAEGQASTCPAIPAPQWSPTAPPYAAVPMWMPGSQPQGHWPTPQTWPPASQHATPPQKSVSSWQGAPKLSQPTPIGLPQPLPRQEPATEKEPRVSDVAEKYNESRNGAAVLCIPQSLTVPALPTFLHGDDDQLFGSDVNLSSMRCMPNSVWKNDDHEKGADPLGRMSLDQRWQVALRSGRGFVMSATADLNPRRSSRTEAEADNAESGHGTESSMLQGLSGLTGDIDGQTAHRKTEINPQQFVGVVCPCEHKDPTSWKRLRLKKGMQHFLCLECGTKWKSPSINSGPNRATAEAHEGPESVKWSVPVNETPFRIEIPAHLTGSTSGPIDIAKLQAYMLQNDPDMRSTQSFMDLKHMQTSDEISGEVPVSYSLQSIEKAGFPESYTTGRLPKPGLEHDDSVERGIIKSWTMDRWDRTGGANWSFGAAPSPDDEILIRPEDPSV